MAYLEPLYRMGKADLEAGNYRKAYAPIQQGDGQEQRLQGCVAHCGRNAVTKGQFIVAVLPFTATEKDGPWPPRCKPTP